MATPRKAVPAFIILSAVLLSAFLTGQPAALAAEPKAREAKPPAVAPAPEDKLPWWPTDAQPGPVKDGAKGGYWWWPSQPGTVKDLWGNRGYAYVNKIIYNWHGGQGGVAKYVHVTVDQVTGVKMDMKPSLIIKRTVRELKLPFQAGQTELGEDQAPVLKKAVSSLLHNNKASVLISSDPPADDALGLWRGERRAEAVEKYLLEEGIDQKRILLVDPGKFQEAGLRSKKDTAPDVLLLLVAEVAEVMIPGPAEQGSPGPLR